MNAQYTAEAIQTLLGPQYRVKALSQRGSFQVNLELKDGPNDFEKVERLQAAFHKLREAGYPIEKSDFRISAAPRERGGQWTSWCSIFVNRPSAEASTDVSAQVAAGVVAALKALGVQIPATPAPAPAPSTDAVVEDPPAPI